MLFAAAHTCPYPCREETPHYRLDYLFDNARSAYFQLCLCVLVPTNPTTTAGWSVRKRRLASAHFQGRRVAAFRCCLCPVGVLSLSGGNHQGGGVGMGVCSSAHGVSESLDLSLACERIKVGGGWRAFTVSVIGIWGGGGWVHSRCELILRIAGSSRCHLRVRIDVACDVTASERVPRCDPQYNTVCDHPRFAEA